MSTTCVNLRERYSDRYRIECDPSCERAHHGELCYKWLTTIQCEHGHIYVHGGAILGASTNTRGPIANRLAQLPGVRVTQDGDDGINAVFHVLSFAEVAKIMKPKRRRRLTPEQKAEGTERLRKYRFTSASKHAGEDRRRAPEGTCVPGATHAPSVR